MNKDKLQEIHDSLVNRQRQQMVQQIDGYGLYDFFKDYTDFLLRFYDEIDGYNYLTDIVISYHRIKNR